MSTIYFLGIDVNKKLLDRFLKINHISGEGKHVSSIKRLLNYKHVDGVIFDESADRSLLNQIRDKGIPCMFCSDDDDRIDEYLSEIPTHTLKADRFSTNGYEVTTKGDSRFSPFVARFGNRSLEDIYQLDIKGGSYLGATSWRAMKGVSPLVIETTSTPWTRESVKHDPHSLYLFTDNLLRTSGKNPISFGEYLSKYGNGKELCYPTMTQAVIRGLSNAYPITTMKDCYKNQLTDNMIMYMERLWSSELADIRRAYRTGKYNRIVVSSRIIGYGRYSNIKENAPALFKVLCKILSRLGIDNSGNEVKSLLPKRDIYDSYRNLYMSWFCENPELIIELIELTRNKDSLTDMFWTKGISQSLIISQIINDYFAG